MNQSTTTRGTFSTASDYGEVPSHRYRRRRGQVLAMVLLSLTFLMGLVFYVYNVGDAVNRRVDLQTAADAAAVSGAGWMARSMNVVAMNNVAISRMLSCVVVLDALPLATEMSLNETTEWQKGIERQLALGVPNIPAGQLVREGLESLQARMKAQCAILEPLDQAINRGSFNMASATHWASGDNRDPRPYGAFWRAAMDMDNLSQATAASAGQLAQMNAGMFARVNGVSKAFIVPVIPQFPGWRGSMDDFQPVLEGDEVVTSTSARWKKTGGAGGAIIAQHPDSLGPWARLFRWRLPLRNPTGQEWVPSTNGVGQVRGGHGVITVGGRRVGSSAATLGNGYWRATGYINTGYRTYGPYYWMIERINGWALQNLSNTLFAHYMRDLSRTKLGYMFPSGTIKTEQPYPYPSWITDYPQSQAKAASPDIRVRKTMFYCVEIASRYPEGDPNYLSPGSYRTNGKQPIAIWADGWVNPAQWPVPMISPYIWKDSYSYQVTQDTGLGLPADTDSAGQPIWHTVYMSAWYIFGGIDIGDDRPISNPCNWNDDDVLPAPMTSLPLHQYGQGRGDDGSWLVGARFLGAAFQKSTAPLWSARFKNEVPGSQLALTEVKLFNPTSMDLWTQDWQVQLAPIYHLTERKPDPSWTDSLEWWTLLFVDNKAVCPVDINDLYTVWQMMARMDNTMEGQYLKH